MTTLEAAIDKLARTVRELVIHFEVWTEEDQAWWQRYAARMGWEVEP